MVFKTFSLSDNDQRVIALIQKALKEKEGPVPTAQVIRRALYLFVKAHNIDVEKGE